MGQKSSSLLPPAEELLRQFGDRLRIARLRRKLSAKQVAERAGMAPMTLRSVEHGGAGATIGAYLAVMQVLGIEKDLALLAQADPTGHRLQDARLPSGTRYASARAHEISNLEPPAEIASPQTTKPSSSRKLISSDWLKDGAFASSDSLAALIVPTNSPKKKVR